MNTNAYDWEKCAKIFDWENKLTMDSCALQAKENDNISIVDYYTYNSINCENQDSKPCSKTDLMYYNPNLRFRNGYGLTDACNVETDSKARYVQFTHGPEKKQLCVRNFKAVPDFAKGNLSITTIDSYLKNALDTSVDKDCAKLSEKTIQRFIPLNDCVKNHIDKYSPNYEHGVNTRELWRCIARQK